jgi:hypothetical protein
VEVCDGVRPGLPGHGYISLYLLHHACVKEHGGRSRGRRRAPVVEARSSARARPPL